MSWNAPPNGQPGLMQPRFHSPTMGPSSMQGLPPNMQGPPQNMQGPPQSMQGPPPNMQGPPQRMQGPPPSMPGPPPSMPGPPPSMQRPPVGIQRPPVNAGPPMNMQYSTAGPPQMGHSLPPSLLNPPRSGGDQGSNYMPQHGQNGAPTGAPMVNSGPPKPGNPDSPQISRPPNAAAASSELLPAPYHGKGIYSHTTHVGPPLSQSITPTNSEPTSLNVSRVPSPIPNQHFDALEGQFRSGTPNSNLGTPPSGSPVPQATPSPRGLNSRPHFPPPHLTNGPPQSGHTSPSHPHTTGLQPPISQMPPPPTAGPVVGHPQTQNRFPSQTAGLGPPSGMTMAGPPQGPSYGPQGNHVMPPGPAPLPHSQPFQPGNFQTQPSALGQPTTSNLSAPPNYGPGVPPTGAQNNAYGLNSQFGAMGLQQQHHQMPVELRTFNLLQERNILPADAVVPPRPNLPEHLIKNNCSPDIFRCTLNAMPQSNSLLQKSRLPLGILIHPFKDLAHLPVIQSSVIVRCRSCRTYINPFVTFIDQRRWRCNLCFRANELPEEFNFDPVSKSYGSPERRPEIKAATIEFVAPSEYMLRPPQPCVYIFLLDVSYNAVQNGYLQSFCEVLSEELDKVPGDSRMMVGFITYNSSIHFYNLSEELSTPQIHVVSDVDDIFLPLPEGLLANLQSSRPLIDQLLQQLPTYHQDEFVRDDSSAMGAALQAALKLATPSGGRVTVIQTTMPNVGPGKLQNREDPNQRASSKPANLQPATDFYKLLSLEAAGQQIAIDMFLLNQQYTDYATIGGAARHSGGSLHSFPGLHTMHNPAEVERFEHEFRRYLCRKIGLEAVMRVRCTKGLAIHSFHGNFFVRSTDLLSLPNINPDAGFGMQVSIEDNLTDSPYACFQAALLYTSSKGERRIRVHTMCVPVTTSLPEVINGADQQAIISVLSKMAVDRSINSAVSDAREALVNACVDALGAYGVTLSSQQRMGTLPAPYSLRLLPLYVSALLKHPSIRVGVSTKTDDRVYAMDECKTLPLARLMQVLVPDLYPVHALNDHGGLSREDVVVPQPPRLSLSSGSIDHHGAFLLDVGSYLYLWIGSAISQQFCAQVFDKADFQSIQDGPCDLAELENETSEKLRLFIAYLQESRSSIPPVIIVREDSRNRHLFIQHMIEDKTECSMSYYEFLQHLQKQLKSS